MFVDLYKMAGGNAVIEAACASLVREYLSRKGLKVTLQKMDEEFPRNELSISNRQALIKHVHLEKLMIRNKEQLEPLKAMLEVMTKHFMEHKQCSPSLMEQMKLVNISQGSDNGPKSDPKSSPLTNQALGKPLRNLDTMTFPTKRDRTSSDLIMDEDVEGETVMGVGRSGIMTLETTESPPQYATKTSQPLSAKQGRGAIFSNDHAVRRRSQPIKPSRTQVSQEDQQKKSSSIQDGRNESWQDFLATKQTLNKDTANSLKQSLSTNSPEVSLSAAKSSRKLSEPEDSPASFEALLLKGEEKANLLQRKELYIENDSISKQYKIEESSMAAEKSKPSRNKGQNSAKMMDLELGEVDSSGSSPVDVQLKPAVASIQKPVKLTKLQSAPIDLKTAISLKNVVLGSPTHLYCDEWLEQSLSFCDIPDIKYGLVQTKGGPCGVLAAIQSCLLQEILFGKDKLPADRFKNLSRTERSKALAAALSQIFWRAGDYSRAVVTIPSQTSHVLSSSKFKQDGVTEKLNIYTFTNFDELSSFMIQSVPQPLAGFPPLQFENDGCPGVILAVYSAMLSRKTHLVLGDFDVPEQTTLIGGHGYCTQELVNLLLTGRAVSNIFNDIVQLDSGGIGQTVTLKGISKRSEIGYLSLFEHYKSCQIGTYYKTPKNPIWVVCSESHFSVLFSTRKDLINDWKAERIFDLIYYDGLANQQEEIRLTVSTINQSYKYTAADEDMVPPLEHCIRTKWPDAEIDWNGCDPIL